MSVQLACITAGARLYASVTLHAASEYDKKEKKRKKRVNIAYTSTFVLPPLFPFRQLPIPVTLPLPEQRNFIEIRRNFVKEKLSSVHVLIRT